MSWLDDFGVRVLDNVMIGGPALTIIYFEDFAISDILSIYPNILGTMNFVFVLSEPCMLFILRGLFSFLFHCQYFYRTVVYIYMSKAVGVLYEQELLTILGHLG